MSYRLRNRFKKKLDLLNLLRVVMALVIFEIHVCNYSISRGMTLNLFTFWLSTPWWLGNWVFFMISGYVLGKGFRSGKYTTDKKGIFHFYFRRFTRVCIPAWIIMLFLFSLGFMKEMVSQKQVLFRLLTFRYYGGLSEAGTGAFWYLSALVKFYLLTPFICIAMKKLHISDRKSGSAAFAAVSISGFLYRLFIYGMKLDYYSNVLISVLGNFDFFVCGMLLNFVISEPNKKECKISERRHGNTAVLFLLAVVCSGCFINYHYDELRWLRNYICPTAAIYAIGWYFNIASEKTSRESSFGYFVDAFAKISFSFFLLHSVILVNLASVLQSRGYIFHIQFAAAAFILTAAVSFLFEIIFEKIRFWGGVL